MLSTCTRTWRPLSSRSSVLLADGDVPPGFDSAPNVVSEYFAQPETRYFEHLLAIMEHDGVADTLERFVRDGESSEGYAGGFVLILVLFILLVIIGAGFGDEPMYSAEAGR